MKKYKKQNYKKIIAIALATIITVPSFFVTALAVTSGGIDKVNIPFISNQGSTKEVPRPDSVNSIANVPKVQLEQTDKINMVNASPNSNDVYKSERVYDKNTEEGQQANQSKTNLAQSAVGTNSPNPVKDKYNYSKADLEKLVADGYSVKEIFQSDDLANSIDQDPKTILKRSKQEGKNIDSVEKEIWNERNEKVLEKLSKKYPNQYKEMESDSLSDNQKRIMLEFVDKNNISSVKDLAKNYKSIGDKAFTNFNKNIKANALLKSACKISLDKLNKYNLTQSDVGNISEDMLDNIAKTAQENGVTVKELLKKLRDRGLGK